VDCGRFLYRTGRQDGGFPPTRAPASLRQMRGRLYLACLGCGARIPVEARGGRFVTPLEGLVRLPRSWRTGPPNPEPERSSDTREARRLVESPAAGGTRRRPQIRPIGNTGAFECVECAKVRHTHRQVRRTSARVGRRYGIRATCRWCDASRFFPRTHDTDGAD